MVEVVHLEEVVLSEEAMVEVDPLVIMVHLEEGTVEAALSEETMAGVVHLEEAMVVVDLLEVTVVSTEVWVNQLFLRKQRRKWSLWRKWLFQSGHGGYDK
ncbi:unnamed protein product [Lepeophtheirus salmonis]|uniref:(salmon louse) hypothetical protein n=1 Tax=Lepeophtheirus salmonis TaxID=72036 RepID=A0A7R8HA24_LEPSM|nr:unnamed protein product [Lepeophtheirus salmonis]CAF2965964.1 unnamed protein product [Lepeophtheirus salmonis]